MKALAVILIAALVYGCTAEGHHKIDVSDIKHLLRCRDKNLGPKEDFNVEQVIEMWRYSANKTSISFVVKYLLIVD